MLLQSLVTESDLHLAGRLIVRTELLRSLRTRLMLARLWNAQPAILDRPIVTPVFVVGLGRSGTSILHELLAIDPANRPALTWELLHPAEAASGDPDTVRDRPTVGRSRPLLLDRRAAGVRHHARNAGDLPNEDILRDGPRGPLRSLVRRARGSHLLEAPRARRTRSTRTVTTAGSCRPCKAPAADTRGGSSKRPSHLSALRTLLDVYPDARIVQIHRDPLKTVPSTLSLLGTLKWIRCNRTDIGASAPLLPVGFARMLDRVIADRATGRLPDDQFVDVRYADLMNDPGSTVATIYERLGSNVDDDVRRHVREHDRAEAEGRTRGAPLLARRLRT